MPDSGSKTLLSKKSFLTAGIFFLLIAGAVLLYFGYPVARKLFPVCPFYTLTRLYCPGCGSTRAAFYLLHCDIAGVFRSNIIFLPTLLFAFLLWLKPKIFCRTNIMIIYLAVIVFYWILRNIPALSVLAPAPVPF